MFRYEPPSLWDCSYPVSNQGWIEMKTTVIVPPEGEPVALSAVKDYLRIGHEGEDALVGSLIGSARARLEAELDMALVARALNLRLDAWPAQLAARGLLLRPGPVTALVDVVSFDDEGAGEVVTPRFILSGGRLRLRPWSFLPAVFPGGHVDIVFETGFGAAGSIPDDLQLAVKMLAAIGYRLRDGGRESDEDALPADIDELLAPYRGVRL